MAEVVNSPVNSATSPAPDELSTGYPDPNADGRRTTVDGKLAPSEHVVPPAGIRHTRSCNVTGARVETPAPSMSFRSNNPDTDTDPVDSVMLKPAPIVVQALSAPDSPATRHCTRAVYPGSLGFGSAPATRTVPVEDNPASGGGAVNDGVPNPARNCVVAVVPAPLVETALTTCVPGVFGIDTDVETTPAGDASTLGCGAPSTVTVIEAGAEKPLPDADAVQETGASGTSASHVSCATPAHVIVGAAGVPVATRIVVHSDHVPFHNPGSSLTAALTTYWVLSVNPVPS